MELRIIFNERFNMFPDYLLFQLFFITKYHSSYIDDYSQLFLACPIFDWMK